MPRPVVSVISQCHSQCIIGAYVFKLLGEIY